MTIDDSLYFEINSVVERLKRISDAIQPAIQAGELEFTPTHQEVRALVSLFGRIPKA